MNVTPQNFNRVCDRFAIVCDEEQAKEIFSSHGLSPEGCNIYSLATSLNNASRHILILDAVNACTRCGPEARARRSGAYHWRSLQVCTEACLFAPSRRK